VNDSRAFWVGLGVEILGIGIFVLWPTPPRILPLAIVVTGLILLAYGLHPSIDINTIRRKIATFIAPKIDNPKLPVEDYAHATDTVEVIKRNPQIDFYENREALNRLRGGLQAELAVVEVAWLATATGIYASNLSLFETGKIKRLLLLKPDVEGHLRTFARGVPDWPPDRLADLIKITTTSAKAAGVEVRWYDGPLMSALYGDPYSDHGWTRVEVFTPHYADRMGILVTADVYTSLHKTLVASFDKQWNEAVLADETSLVTIPDVAARRRAIKEDLRNFRNTVQRDLPVADPEGMYFTFQQIADYIEDTVSKEERERFWSDDGLNGRNLDGYGRRLWRLGDLLDRIDELELPS